MPANTATKILSLYFETALIYTGLEFEATFTLNDVDHSTTGAKREYKYILAFKNTNIICLR